jgi:hypothetical protein
MYTAPAYSFAVMLGNLPIQLIATTIFGVIIYFMTGYSLSASRFFFYLWTLFSMELCMNSFFRYCAFAFPTMPASFVVSSAGTGVLLMCELMLGCVGSLVDVSHFPTSEFALCAVGGFIISLKNIPSYGLGLFYLSPFSWVVRSLVLNEFTSSVSTKVFPKSFPFIGMHSSLFYCRITTVFWALLVRRVRATRFLTSSASRRATVGSTGVSSFSALATICSGD